MLESKKADGIFGFWDVSVCLVERNGESEFVVRKYKVYGKGCSDLLKGPVEMMMMMMIQETRTGFSSGFQGVFSVLQIPISYSVVFS